MVDIIINQEVLTLEPQVAEVVEITQFISDSLQLPTSAGIQSKITNTAAAGGGEVFIPAGTYTFNRVGGATGKFIELPNCARGLRIRGAGKGKTILKVADSSGDYWAFMAGTIQSTVLDWLEVCDLTIDLNTPNNPLVTAASLATSPRQCINALADYAYIHDVEIRNHTGVNGFYITGDSMRIERNTWTAVGNAPASEGHDHSTYYLSGERIIITDNIFEAASPLGARTAIEPHSGSCIVKGNHVFGYTRGINLTGVEPQTSDSIICTNNVIKKAMSGIALYSMDALGATGPGARNVTIADNEVVIDRDYMLPFAAEIQSYYPIGILLDQLSDLHVENVTVARNNIKFLPYASAAGADERDAAGVTWTRSVAADVDDKRVRIIDNTIINPPGPGVRIGTDIDGLDISRNTIIDPGGSNHGSTPGSFKVGIIVTNEQADITIDDNVILDLRGTHLITLGVNAEVITAAVNAHARRNIVRCADGTTIRSFSGASGTGKAFMIDAVEQTWLGLSTPVKPGSRITDLATGIAYTNTIPTDGGTPAWISDTLATINAQGGTTYTLVLSDLKKLVTFSNAAAITLTVPTNATAAFPIGTTIDLAQIGTGQVTVAGASGVTIVSRGGALKIAGQYGPATLIKVDVNVWLFIGDIST